MFTVIDTVAVALSARTADRAMALTCELPAESGTGKIPAALLGKLPAGPAEITSSEALRSGSRSAARALRMRGRIAGSALVPSSKVTVLLVCSSCTGCWSAA